MVAVYVLAGTSHLLKPGIYIAIMPEWLPMHAQLVMICGMLEIILGLLLLATATRRAAAWLIILLLIAVFPANVQMAMNYGRTNDPLFWLTLVRLPFQLVLIWWAGNYARKPKRITSRAYGF